ncbi:TonB-dependent receptor [Sediminicola luteus]|uniref:Colicin I receptor n=1 Tax=Sediminicola luteus TaxID=319238 RepID=A0A2A4GE64_9FLAO|nr:TonB-dependent receptor [Sediminicola luteus]PCE66276.1 colicin I receptor [Sediminicola luteus]
MKFHLLFALLVFPFLVLSQTGHLEGTITHKDAPAPYITVFIKGKSIGTTSDAQGKYHLDVPLGTHTLVCQGIGYKTLEKTITLTQNRTILTDFDLEEDVLGLDQVVVSATRNNLNRKEAPVIVSVTNSAVLNSTQSLSLSEGLNFQPGLRMETNCQNCGFSQVRINGLDGAYSQILVNSKPVFSALNGVYGLDQIPVNMIDRIEVVRGGGSALYGSNAIAGTINIITKEPIEDAFQIGSNLGLIGGEAADKALTLNATIVDDALKSGITLFGMYRDRQPFDMDGDGFTEVTQMQNQTLGFNTFYKPTDRSKLSADFYTINEERRGGNQLDLQPFESDITETIDSEIISGGLAYEHYNKDASTSYSLYGTLQLSKNDNFYGGKGDTLEESVRGFGNSKDDVYVLGSQFTQKMESFLGGSGIFTGGLEFKYNLTQDAKPGFNAFIDQQIRIYSVYGQQEWQIRPNLKLLGGLRADVHNLTEKDINLNPRLNLLYNLTPDIQLRASYAKGFRAPQYFTEDVHSSVAAGEVSFVRFAPGLKSETSHTYLASFDLSKSTPKGDYGLTLEGFYTRLNDPFVNEQATDEELDELGITPVEGQFIYLKKNSPGADVYGMNLEGKYAPNEKWQLQMGATLQRSQYDEKVAWSEDPDAITDDADQFFKSPNLYGNLIVTFAPTKRWQNNLSAVYTGSMFVPHIAGYIPNDRLEKTDDFLELNLKTAYTFDIHKDYQLEVGGGIQNLFNSYQPDFDKGPDRDANYVYGPSRPRTYFISLKIGSLLN